MSDTKYSTAEILQILNDFYNCQTAFDPEVDLDKQLTFENTISDWRAICDLVEPKKLAKCYYDLFNLTTSIGDLENILSEKQNELKVFCAYISEHATKQTIAPIVMMGQSCMTAAIFKTLIANLKKRGVKTQDIKPSSKFIPLFHKYGGVLLEEVNKLAPGSLTKFEYRNNWIVETGISITLVFFLSIIIIPVIWHFHWTLMITLALGLVVIFIGNKFKPEKENIGGYDTIKDLILGMQAQINKAI
ncbi:MAG: hypothetical protein ACHQIM_01525 [Sphingobacteriales bacterium]